MDSELCMTKLQGVAQRDAVLQPYAATQQRTRRATMAMGLLAALGAAIRPVLAAGASGTRFQRVPAQFIAALGEPGASSGGGAQSWGLWVLDPGPRGVGLGSYGRLTNTGGIAPAGWKFDAADWWLEEHGLIMEQPDFPVPARKYMVTGDRDVTAMLTIHPADQDGNVRWELANGATLHDVTHLGCRAGRYRPAAGGGSCSPANAQKTGFPVAPGAAMPPVAGCSKQDYAVLIVIGIGTDN